MWRSKFLTLIISSQNYAGSKVLVVQNYDDIMLSILDKTKLDTESLNFAAVVLKTLYVLSWRYNNS
jgi:hypothetical protein